MLVGLVITGGLYSALAPASAEETSSTDDLVAEGRELYLVGCSTCHGLNGEGVRLADGESQLGPSLVGVGAAAVDFQVGTGRMPAAGPAAQIPKKPVVYTQEEIDALAAYVASLGPGPAVPTPEQYSLDVYLETLPEEEREAAREEAIVRGGEIFFDNCTACHNFQGSGGAMPQGGHAPSLHGVEPRHIYSAMLTGPQAMDVFSDGNITPEEKRDVIAFIESIQENPGYGGYGMGGLGPVSEGMFAWILGIGSLVGAAIWIAAHTTRSNKKKAEA
jgi:ubiquinol-cytochrome c reductase cytochrome c subunit